MSTGQVVAEMESSYPALSSTSSILIQVVQHLSQVGSMEELTKVVRSAARKLAGADGATFVLRDEDKCYYVDEEAISPLWKGRKFPLQACISGWSMLNRKQASIQDIYKDDRIPYDVYQPTFVKSLLMTPIRKSSPIGAIGVYWADIHQPSEREQDTLQALADATSIAIKNLETLENLEKQIIELEQANQRMSRMTWMVSHDLSEPLRNISMQTALLEEELNDLKPEVTDRIEKVKGSVKITQQLILDLIEVARVGIDRGEDGRM